MPSKKSKVRRSVFFCTLLLSFIGPIYALDRPWICDTFFYWYTWDYDKKLGNWLGGVYNTPLSGYYDSRTYKDNKRSLWQASEWGITHHFIDYWSPDWLGEGGEMREKIVYRAAEDLQKEGYDIWMSYYQDGWNFDTKYFSRNISEKRDTYLWLKLFSSSPVQIKLNGYPFKLIYSRNGVPQTTIDNQGFVTYLRSLYPSVEELNKEWGTDFKSFEDIKMDFNATGHQRAYSIRYQYEIWKKEWEKLNELIRNEFNLPGMKVSFDVAYEPFMGFSYSLFAKVLGGPHSYGGIFGQPQEQDVQRFIQSIVAKKYNTVFFDHFKNYYTDWEIRIPGTCYPPEPFHFDRFWCSALLRYSEALLHLSWNEWWEGSNLEPCWEYGKKFCEKNLFWATLMWEIFPQLRSFGRNAEVALILNEWPLLSNEGNIQELYQTIQILRQLNIPFDLVPDDLLTAETLSPFKVVIAPACEVGFGYNQNNNRVIDILLNWVKASRNHKLILSGSPDIAKILGLETRRSEKQLKTGNDMNFFLDIGEKGDEKFILKGSSFQEDWGALPPEAYGKAERRLTVRWFPGNGLVSSFLLPLSPNRDLVLRFRGNALWENEITVFLNGREAGKIKIVPGWNIYELKIPSQLVTDYLGELVFAFQKANIPSQLEPQRFETENRVCNIAIDWLQLSTPNFPPQDTRQVYHLPEEKIIFRKDFAHLDLPTSYRIVAPLFAKEGTVLSYYETSNIPRDMVLQLGEGNVLYVNGSFSDTVDKRYWRTILKWAGITPKEYVAGDNVIGEVFWKDNTAFILAYNHNITKKPIVKIKIPALPLPVAEVMSLNTDGETFKGIKYNLKGKQIEFQRPLSYYSAFQVVFSPIKLLSQSFDVTIGERKSLAIELENQTSAPQEVTIRIRAYFPSIKSKDVLCKFKPFEKKTVMIPLIAKENIDWGRKTIVIELAGKWGKSVFLRPLIVNALPQLVLVNKIVDFKNPRLTIRNEPNTFTPRAPAKNIVIKIDDKIINVGELEAGKEISLSLPPVPNHSNSLNLLAKDITLSYYAGSQKKEISQKIYYALYPDAFQAPKGALKPIFVFNPRSSILENEVVEIPWRGEKVGIVDQLGNPVPSSYNDGKLSFAPIVPPLSCSVYYIAPLSEYPTTDLYLKREGSQVKIENSFFAITLDEDKGGAIVSFLSKLTGKDYGSGISGASYGEFGSFDPLNPAITSDRFIKDNLKHQSAGKGKIQVLQSTPLVVSLLVTYEDPAIKAKQYIDFYAFRDSFHIRSEVEPKKAFPEISPFALRLIAHSLSKIYPNFIGISTDEPSPHFGWRQGSYVPPYITLMEPDKFPESISILINQANNISDVRYGFFPPQRGKPGPRTYAWVEFLSKKTTPCSVDIWIKLHSGYQIVAEASHDALKQQPYIVIGKAIIEQKEQGLSTYSPTWTDSYRKNRIKLVVMPREDSVDEVLSIKLPFQDEIDSSSLKAIEYSEGFKKVIGIRPCIYDETTNELRILMSGKSDKGSPRFFIVYYAKGKGQFANPYPFIIQGDRLLNPSFENGGEWWSFSNASIYEKEAYSGKFSALLTLPTGMGHSLITNDSLRVLPNSKYKVSFYAKVLEGNGLLRTNFYFDPKYDFEQIVVPLINDGNWHKYEVEVPTGDFPQNVHPYFRIWAIGSPQVVLIDDVEVFPLQKNENITIIEMEKEELK
ncbi:carbohydrate binding domain-containing protein [bacterium]|nr:carbohydrate binding domain-containing protein [bacterium]